METKHLETLATKVRHDPFFLAHAFAMSGLRDWQLTSCLKMQGSDSNEQFMLLSLCTKPVTDLDMQRICKRFSVDKDRLATLLLITDATYAKIKQWEVQK